MSKKTRIKAKLKKNIVTVKLLAKHEMLTYVQAKSSKKEANFITNMLAKINDNIVFEASTSQFLSKDPYIKFKVDAEVLGIKKGDEVVFSWTDLKGNVQTDSKKIK